MAEIESAEDKIGPKENNKKDQDFNCKPCFKKFISKVVFEIHLKFNMKY